MVSFPRKIVAIGIAMLLLVGAALPDLNTEASPLSVEKFADTAFRSVWERTDQLVGGGGQANRTWLWGPAPSTTLNEEYGENGKRRLVQYFDKSRMEITNPQGNRTSQWFVTNGLLARELISGDMQLGDNTFLKRQPALVQVAGDQDDPNSPTYADLKSLSTLAPGQNLAGDATGSFVNAGLVKGEGVTATGSLGQTYGVRYTNFDAQSGHNIAGPFWDFLNSSGPVLENGKLVTGKLFDPTFFATGLPLSEAYWVRTRVGGVEKDVLVQVFERRVLTYTPSNEAQWRVEMGNTGQHYFRWRYGDQDKAPLVYDARFGMTVLGIGSATTMDTYLKNLGGPAMWYNYYPLKVSAEASKSRVQLVNTRTNWTFAPGTLERKTLDTLLADAPAGSYWLIGTEPNVDGQDDISPAGYAHEYEFIKNMIRAKDPTAIMIGPNALNWNYTCNGCPGYNQADGWTRQLLQEYRQLYGHEIDFDVWGIHTYGLNWNKLPLTDYQQDISQVVAFREFLKTQPAQANKPIWITEFGVIWGYDGIEWKQDNTGNWIAIPTGTYQKQALINYLNYYTDWLVTEGPRYGVKQWFLYASAGIPESYTTTFSGINLFDGLTPESKLTDFGQLYRTKALQAASIVANN